MKKYILGTLLVIASLGLSSIFFLNEGAGEGTQEGVDRKWLVPEGFSGCAVIRYNVEGAEPLTINENNEFVFEVPRDRVIETSSPQDYGWVNEDHAGPFQISAYYVDEDGKIIEEIPWEDIGPGSNGTFVDADGTEYHHATQYFNADRSPFTKCPKIAQ
ncbi:hypothetical protein VKA52_09920 [Halobacillus sp. HZG1]|uniref:DUF6843 domain-containing protein n=1 Tax=Halobacillus sp. HZG1 TaxID=3111769 RepID=UPI002DBEFEE0|nr:hypothetical protein [Halobacillus sp. HZG1]MEC3884039.1 hypothetical protein [Halobacillus sp. HZG1]